jgi:hypothetical protein
MPIFRAELSAESMGHHPFMLMARSLTLGLKTFSSFSLNKKGDLLERYYHQRLFS